MRSSLFCVWRSNNSKRVKIAGGIWSIYIIPLTRMEFTSAVLNSRLKLGPISTFWIMGFIVEFETIRAPLMKPKWQKQASVAQEICTL